MNKYKVEIIETQKYIIDVLGETEQEARDKATEKFTDIQEAGMKHYHEEGDMVEETGLVYDVTNTDDSFEDICTTCKGENRRNCIACKGSGFNA